MELSKIANVTDGTSNTIIVGEALPTEDANNEVWVRTGAGSGTTIPINWKNQSAVRRIRCRCPLEDASYAARGFKSRHPGGSNFLFWPVMDRFTSSRTRSTR